MICRYISSNLSRCCLLSLVCSIHIPYAGALKVPDSVTANTSAANGTDTVAAAAAPVQGAGRPYVLPLRRESIPVKRKGQVVSFKTSYSGIIHVGSPKPQEFRVVFDTGSGHVILPAKECKSDSCLVHRRYSMKKSRTARAINMDGSIVLRGEICDQATVGFGTGQVTGEFVQERVCLGPPPSKSKRRDATASTGQHQAPCNEMHLIVATEMSSQPFRSFDFDGVIGMGLSGLALTANFSFFHMAQESSHADLSQFGVFLTEGEDGEDSSEIAIGGYNLDRVIGDLSWAPVTHPELGHWLVAIDAIRINGEPLEACKKGCRGMIDTGTSHWAVPSPHDESIAELLTVAAGELLDCRLAAAPEVEIEIAGFTLTLHPRNYMRRLPLRDGVTVGSKRGIVLQNLTNTNPEDTAGSTTANASSSPVAADANPVRRCKPKVMGVTLPAPLGPDLFIFGEPLLHRYYTVFDSRSPRVGFGLAAHEMNTEGPERGRKGLGVLPEDVEFLL